MAAARRLGYPAAVEESERIKRIIDRALHARLFRQRDQLLAGVPAQIEAFIPTSNVPAEQLSHDLSRLQGLESAEIVYLIGWLKTAARLTQGGDRAFFKQQAAHFEDRHPPPGLRVRWRFAPHTPPLGDLRVAPDVRRLTLGRRHLGAEPADFVPLTSAPWRISPKHVHVDVVDAQLHITRPPGAGMLGSPGADPYWLPRNGTRTLGRVADLDLGGALRVLIELHVG